MLSTLSLPKVKKKKLVFSKLQGTFGSVSKYCAF